jgi:hypothetical protein
MKRIFIAIFCCVSSGINQLIIRPASQGYDGLIDAFLGSLPSFLFTIGFASLLLYLFLKYTKQLFSKALLSATLASLIGTISREVWASNSLGFGGTFDYYDIIASFFGACFFYFLETISKNDTTGSSSR